MINWNIAKNPLNWFIVTLMVTIAAIGFHVVAQYFSNSSKSGS